MNRTKDGRLDGRIASPFVATPGVFRTCRLLFVYCLAILIGGVVPLAPNLAKLG